MPAEPSPTVRRRQLGIILRRRREALGLTAQDVAARVMISPAKLSRLESGRRPPSPRDVRDLCDLYGITDQDERDRLMDLVKQGNERGWWHELDLPATTFVELEGAAKRLSNWETAFVPGLLQTPAYMERVLSTWEAGLTAHQVDQAMHARRIRQERLTGSDPPELAVIIDESVLHRAIGDIVMQHAQLAHLIEVGRLPHVTVQVMPFRAGLHEAMNSSFTMLDFDAELYESVVFIEGMTGYHYVEKPEEVARYRTVFDRLSGIAMNPDESAAFIALFLE